MGSKGKEKYSDPWEHTADSMSNEDFERWLSTQQANEDQTDDTLSELTKSIESKLNIGSKLDYKWLLNTCESIFSVEGMNSNEIAAHICNIISDMECVSSSEAIESRIQSNLLEFLGFEQVEIVSEILVNRHSILSTKDQSSSRRIVHVPAHGPQVKISLSENAAKDLHGKHAQQTSTSFTPQSYKIEDLPNVYISRKPGIPISSRISKMALPAGTEHENGRDYESFAIPYHSTQSLKAEHIKPVLVESLDAIGRSAFAGYTSLNRLQSAVYPIAYGSNENMLVCAPTGAGKTDAAMLAVLKTIREHHRISSDVQIIVDLDAFKIVYVAPMKALASEITAKFGRRLAPLGVKVHEYTGDVQLTQAQLKATQMLVTTPEKWDVVTRKSGGSSDDQDFRSLLIGKVRLLVLDEVHLLQDERGAVLEALVARTLRLVEQQQRMIRIVGLSATLPNFVDVSAFLGVNLHVGLFYFDDAFRPVPLRQTIIGVKSTAPQPKASSEEPRDLSDNLTNTSSTSTKATPSREHWSVKEATTRVCFDRMIGFLRGENSQSLDRSRVPQVMIFVHSRNETASTARDLVRMAAEEGLSGLLKCEDLTPDPSHRGHVGNHPILRDLKNIRNRDLRELVSLGFAIHHAGNGEYGSVLIF